MTYLDLVTIMGFHWARAWCKFFSQTPPVALLFRGNFVAYRWCIFGEGCTSSVSTQRSLTVSKFEFKKKKTLMLTWRAVTFILLTAGSAFQPRKPRQGFDHQVAPSDWVVTWKRLNLGASSWAPPLPCPALPPLPSHQRSCLIAVQFKNHPPLTHTPNYIYIYIYIYI